MAELIQYEPIPEGLHFRAGDLPTILLSYLERQIYENLGSSVIRISNHAGGEPALQSRFLEVKEVKHTADRERSFHPYNMQNVISSLRGGGHGLVYLLRSAGGHVHLYMGARQLSRDAIEPEREVDILRHTLASNYPGIVVSTDALLRTESDFLPLTRHVIQDALVSLTEAKHAFAITGIPSNRGSARLFDASTQSIDILVDALRDEDYSLMVLAEPISDERITEMLYRQYKLGDDIHRLVRRSLQISEGSALGDTVTISSAFALFLSLSAGKSRSESRTTNKTIVQDELNKAAEACERLLDQYQIRLDAGRNFGYWTTGVFLGSNSENTAMRLQSVARSIFAGDRTHFEPLRLIDIGRWQEARESLYYLRNPIIKDGYEFVEHPLGGEYNTLATPLTTEEVAILMSLPHREVPGLKLSEAADFNLNPPRVGGLKLGRLLYRGEPISTDVSVSSQSLTRHTFVTGLTGSGKTNTCMILLADAYRNKKINFMVIDPAKTEYSWLLNAPDLKDNVRVFTVGDEGTAPFRLNPFEFVANFPLLTHIDLLKAVFNAAFPMYASMPYLLEEALLGVYTDRGWDLTTSTNRYVEQGDLNHYKYLPRLSDLYAKIDEVVATKNYDVRLQMDLTAALKARLGSLLQGGKGLMLNTQHSIPMESLLDHPVVLQLQDIGDDEEKAFVMALVFIMLYEASRKRQLSKDLRHVTLIEEAHRLLKNIPASISVETANPRGKTVEMFSDMMAEMRARGEGFVVVDQLPSKLVPDVVKGSNLKVIHRLLAEDDRLFVGNAMGLKREQVDFLPRLTIGQAVVHSEELGEACLVQIDEMENGLATPISAIQLKANRDNIFAEWKEYYRRVPGCMTCSSPCDFHPSRNDPTSPGNAKSSMRLLLSLEQVLTTILVAEKTDVIKAIHTFHHELHRVLDQRYPAGFEQGEELCTLVLTAAEGVRRFYGLHLPSNEWRACLDLQIELVPVLKKGTASAEQLNRFSWFLRQIAADPKVFRTGCQNCAARCRFGHRFQQDGHPAVKALEARIRSLSGYRDLPMDEIVDGAVKALGAPVRAEFRVAVGYCLLTQATDNREWLDELGAVSTAGLAAKE